MVGALGRLSTRAPIYAVATLYVSLVRGTPLIVQMFFIVPRRCREFGIVLPALVAGVFALAFNYGAYMTEIFRAGIQAIPRGQREAAQALGMTERDVMRRVVLPQAIRIVIPAIGNEFIAMIKDSALVSFVGIQELFWRARTIGTAHFQTFETLMIAALMYWMLTIVFSLVQERLERRMAQSERAAVTEAHDPYASPGALTPAGATPIVRAMDLEKFYGDNHVLRACTLEVYPRETICLIGKSGSGKSTLLRCINFLEEPTVGSIEVDGVRVDADPLHHRSREHQEQIRQIRLRRRWCSRSSTCSRT